MKTDMTEPGLMEQDLISTRYLTQGEPAGINEILSTGKMTIS
jgi:hypothetical protein